jgi:hypothetical protein
MRLRDVARGIPMVLAFRLTLPAGCRRRGVRTLRLPLEGGYKVGPSALLPGSRRVPAGLLLALNPTASAAGWYAARHQPSMGALSQALSPFAPAGRRFCFTTRIHWHLIAARGSSWNTALPTSAHCCQCQTVRYPAAQGTVILGWT